MRLIFCFFCGGDKEVGLTMDGVSNEEGRMEFLRLEGILNVDGEQIDFGESGSQISRLLPKVDWLVRLAWYPNGVG